MLFSFPQTLLWRRQQQLVGTDSAPCSGSSPWAILEGFPFSLLSIVKGIKSCCISITVSSSNSSSSGRSRTELFVFVFFLQDRTKWEGRSVTWGDGVEIRKRTKRFSPQPCSCSTWARAAEKTDAPLETTSRASELEKADGPAAEAGIMSLTSRVCAKEVGPRGN